MFPGLVTTAREPLIVAGLPSINAAMIAGGITTPRRIAAALTTWRFESWLIYNQRQLTQTREYYGRGLTQLTGRDTDPDANGDVMNYGPAGRYFGIDLIGDPDLALSLEWSAKIAVWYWTVARPQCNDAADNLEYGRINRALGFPVREVSPGVTNDDLRCRAFAVALEYLTGEPTPPVDCVRRI
jgi:putative chitinase